jgi:hypothetical protein
MWSAPCFPEDGLFLGNDADDVTGFADLLEVHDTLRCGKQRIVAANTNICPGLEFRTALADNDAASEHNLPAEAFHTQTLRIAVPTIP